MKKNKYILLLLIIVNLFALSSCTDTYDLHQKYLEDGETIYTNKVDSVASLPGNNRLKLSGYITNAFNVEKIVVYWNNGENSQTFPYTKSENFTDPLDLVITGLDENSYQFDIFSVDADGNKSVKVTAFGTSFGEIYRSNLESRLLKSYYYKKDSDAIVKFNIKSDLTRDTEVSFTNLSGEDVSVTLGEDDEEVILVNIDPTKEVMYRTNYVPTPMDDETAEETSIDEFTSDWTSYTLPSTLKTIAESFMFTPTLGGSQANWTNENGLNITVEFRKSVAGSIVSSSTTSNEVAGTYEIRGMEPGQQDIEIVVTDIYGNSYATTYSAKPIEAYNRDLWSVIDVSSEEPKENTWGNGGEGIHAIDESTATFWHTQWDLAQPDYPHHLTIDMGESLTILAFEVLGRTKNNNKAAGEHEFWASSDNATWTLIASYTGELSTSKILIETTETTARYIRYNAVAPGSGATNYTFLADLSIYAK
ncbi:DUF4998 domain-containing protein [Thalassobellus suaedae]|uniref:DUF4998 domain-containing protein n=1 Tax=Thalassobellus suaedae TaxID=3074124 RepID=A0ABY9Y638_9FLAO|nr:DUF4998 domain-containing protein [Flavobacteriaceae bacterium HL-DH10]